ncbi:MAG: hypothetical protein H0W47_07805 [Polaromonas sp.]|uniref:hypothetical protein n=1 Tax=Polaromonas sp. TaxID=1869339 RepID=UPI0017FDA0B6|nr:hypothetical protein [Polaromonas sp.]MBA3593693.1 hypothetical protein [Polaromonas sp.]
MSISPYFLDLRSAYQSEMDDLRFDSEGRDVLQQRLTGKRQQIAFLVQMMDISPEMVAVVFHQGFAFTDKALMEQLLTHDEAGLPSWNSLAGGFSLAPWASDLADIVLQAPAGDKFLTLTAGLEYMASLPVPAGIIVSDDETDEDEESEQDGDDELVIFADDGEGGQASDARTRQDAGADWLVQQGFDQKD